MPWKSPQSCVVSVLKIHNVPLLLTVLESVSFGYIVCSACWTTVKIALTPSAVLSSGGGLHVGTYNAGVSTQIHPYLQSCSYLPSRSCGIADSWGPGQQPAGRGKGMRSHKSALVEHWFFCSLERYVWSSLSQGEPGFRVNLTVPLSLPSRWGGEGVSCSIFLLQTSMSSLLVPWSPLTPSQRSNHVSLTVGVPTGLMLGTLSLWQDSVQKAVSSLDGLSEQTSPTTTRLPGPIFTLLPCHKVFGWDTSGSRVASMELQPLAGD